MTMTTIADALKTAPNTLLDGVRGVIKLVSEYNKGSSEIGGKMEPWSLQTVVVTGKNGEEISVEIAHHDAIPVDSVGKFVWLLAHQKPTGGKSGLKVVNEGNGNILRVSKTGEVCFSQPGSAVPQPTAPEQLPQEIEWLRNQSGAGLVDCKNAYIQSGYSTPKALEILRTKDHAIVRKDLPPTAVETEAIPPRTQIGAAEPIIGGSPKDTAIRPAVTPPVTLLDGDTAKIDSYVLLYKTIRARVQFGVGEQLPDSDCVDRATKTIFDSMILSGPF